MRENTSRSDAPACRAHAARFVVSMCVVFLASAATASAATDYGDYSSFSSASSTTNSTLRIGATTDSETSASTNSSATGDDNNGSDDEDGVTLPAALIRGQTMSIVVNVTNNRGGTSYLNAWIDFNRNGLLSDSGERIASNLTVANGTNNSNRTISFTVPSGASLGTAGVRVRLTSSSTSSSTGGVGSGEVEDYVITIANATDFGDYEPFASASSMVNSNLRIGSTTDAEASESTDSTATGDDDSGSDDEDGVTVPASLMTGSSSSITVNVTNTTGSSAYLNAWIDYNRNGSLTDSGEQIASNTIISTGTSNSNRTITFTVPSSASLGSSAVRVRLTSTSSPGPTGADGNGEVEDHAVVLATNMGIGNMIWNDANENGLFDPEESGINNVLVELWTPGADNAIGGTGSNADTKVTSMTTSGGGLYNFSGLAEGYYYVKVPTPPLSRTSLVVDTNDNGEDGDNNASQPGGSSTSAYSPVIQLTPNTEPGSSGSGNIDNTVDFGFAANIGSPFVCDNRFYVIQNEQVSSNVWDSTLYYVGEGPSLVPVFIFTGYKLNGLAAYGGYLYCVDQNGNNLYRINSQGVLVDMGIIAGLPSPGSGGQWSGATALTNGRMILNVYNFSPASTVLYTIDLTSATLVGSGVTCTYSTGGNMSGNFGDIAWDPLTNKVYGYNTVDSSKIGLFEINLTSGVCTKVATTVPSSWGSMIIDANGLTYGFGSAGASGAQDTLYVFNRTNGVLNGSITAVGSGPAVSNSDGAACPGAPPSMKIGDIVWNDANNNGIKDSGEAGIDGVTLQIFLGGQDPLTAAPAATTTTAGGGLYSFNNLSPGQYFIYMPAPPPAYPLSSVPTVTTDNGVDNDDNGIQTAKGQPIRSPLIGLAGGTEPTNDGDNDSNTNLSVDFGLLQPTADYGDHPGFAVASQTASTQIRIGTNATDAEGATPTADNASGDDTTDTDDDDLTIPSVVSGGESSLTIPITLSGGLTLGRIGVWADWNEDGDVFDANETVTLTSSGLIDGTNTVIATLSPPAGTAIGTKYLRVRVTEGTTAPSFSGNSSSKGEVEDYPVTVTAPTMDYGDLPDTIIGTSAGNYQTYTNDNGPSHTANTKLRLGASVDAEGNGQPNSTATGDGADDDGVASLPTLTQNQNATLTINATNTLGSTGFLKTWIDWNNDGNLTADEELGTQISVPNNTSNGSFNFTFTVPGTAISGTPLGLRIRLASVTIPTSTGPVGTGEVEDYLVTVNTSTSDFGDYPNFPAASRTASTLIKIGTAATDPDTSNPTSGTANVDDNTGTDDEDLTMPVLTVGTNGTLTIPVTLTSPVTSGRIAVWADWNGDNLVTGTNETVTLSTASLVTGSNTITATLNAPTGTSGGTKFLRVIATEGTTVPSFSGNSTLRGEVEDYPITVNASTLDFGDLPDTGSGTSSGNYQTLNSDSGPSHTATPTTLRLGATVDTDVDGQPNATATGDGVDEDGIASMPVFNRGKSYTIPVSVFNNTGGTARIFGFIDWNNDGDFADSGEALTAVAVGSSATQQTINVTGTTPGTATIGTFGARFRVATASTLSSTGTTSNGEVEDYIVTGACPTLTITPSSLPATTQYSSYNQTLTATNGTAPYTWTITTGAIPAGLTMSSAGVFSGTVNSASGAYVFTVRATDANGCAATQNYTISVGSGGMSVGNLVFLDENNNGLKDANERGVPNVPVEIWGVGADGRVNTADDQAVTAGTASTLDSGGMLTLGAYGSIASGFSTLTARTDWNGAYQFTELPTGSYYLKITPPNKTLFSSKFGTGSTTYSVNLDFPLASAASNLNDDGADNDNNGVQTNGSFASSADAVVAGVGAAVFTMPFTLATATEPGTSNQGSDEYTIDFGLRPCPAIGITPLTVPAVSTGVAYSTSLSASGGASPYTYAITQGTLPTGLSMSAAGTISGTTSTTGTSAITVRATDARGCQGFTTIQISVTSAMSITTSTLPNGTEGTAYTSTTLAATGSTAPYQNWRVSSGTLPPGLAIGSSTGVLSGTPTLPGTYVFTMAVDDALVTPASVSVTNGSVETDSWSAVPFAPRFSVTGWTFGNSTLSGTSTAVQLYGINNNVTPYGDTPAGSQYLASPFVASWASQTVSGFTVGRPYTLRLRYAMRGAFDHPATAEAQPPFYGNAVWIAGYNGSSATLFGPAGTNFPAAAASNYDTWATLDIPFVPQTSSMVFSYGLDGSAIDDIQFIPTVAATKTATKQFTVVITGNRDWGDLPDTGVGTGAGNYQTTNSDSGPSHYRDTNLRLGTTLDIESDGQPSSTAEGDDLNGGDDDDAITTLPAFERGKPFTIPVSVFNSTGGTARIFAFIDWNNDGDFLDLSEALSAAAVNSSASQQSVNVTGTVPGNAVLLTQIGLRLRLSTAASLGGFGSAVDGEVEDYLVTTTCPAVTLAPTTLPNGTLSNAYSQTISASGGTAPYTYALSSGTLPSGVLLNTSTGVLSGTPNVAASYSFTLRATDANGCQGTRSYSVVMSCPALTITPTTPSPGTVGSAYSQTLTATGGASPYASWTITSGTLPAGLSLNASTGVISGTPTTSNGAGVSITVRTTDANGCQGSQAITLKICPTITVNPASLAGATVNSAYSQTITASGGATPYTFAVSSGTLPSGLSLNASTGVISGMPTSTTSRTFTISATDANGCSGTRSYTLAPACPLISITPATATRGTVGTAYTQALTAVGGIAPYTTWTVTSGTLPSGLSLNASTGVISGTPTTANGAGASVTIRVIDANGCQGSQAINFQICPVISVSPASLPYGTINTAYSQNITASGGSSPYSYAVTSGSLPAGMTLSSAGLLSGTPTSTNAITFIITATDANGCSGSLSYTFSPAPDSDFGDHSLFASASSRMISSLRIGATTDVEVSATTNATATGDDLTGTDDEDGVTIPASVTQGGAGSITVNVTNTSGATAFLNAWMDFNQNGSLTDAGEQIAVNTVIATGTSNNNRVINFTAPAGALLGTTGVRVRLTSVSSPGAAGSVGNGEVEDTTATVVPPTTDYGDFSLFADAFSTGNNGLKLGTVVDLEGSSTTNTSATGDDLTDSDDEDGVTFPSMTAGQPMTLPVIVTNTTGSTAYLNAWIDYNNNGVLTDAGEQIASNVSIITGTSGGTINLNFNVPTNAVTAAALIGTRFRITNVPTPGSTGGVGVGEVEDHGVTILAPLTDFGDFSGAPDVSNTASTNLRLGALVDTEYAATTNSSATGDDNSGVDDEDGVTLPSMMAGAPAIIPVVVTNTTGSPGYLNAWIDYNNNGVFTDVGEQIATNKPVTNGTTNSTVNLNITVPAAAVTGTNLGVRVRISNDISPGSTGAGGVGEVEDHVINIDAPTTDFGDFALFGNVTSTKNSRLKLGAEVDTEYAPTTNNTATGDDDTGTDDEDGVTFPSMIAGAPATIPVLITNRRGSNAYLNAWIDYNGNGDLTDPGEQIASNVSIITSTSNYALDLDIDVPPTTLTGVNLGARVVLTSNSSPDPTGTNGFGEIEDYVVNITAPTTDFGDFSGFADASQGVSPSLRMGASTDAEYASSRNDTATGDDTSGDDDEDGVVLPTMATGQTVTIPVTVTNSTGALGYLNVWIDYNNDGDLNDTGEQIATNINVPTDTADGTINITTTIPSSATTGADVGVRFRLSAPTSPGPTGANPAVGEIEDYVVNIISPTDDTGDFARFGGATSIRNTRLRMGTYVDAEFEATTNDNATGDDLSGTDDEDGVTIPSLVAGSGTTISVKVTNRIGTTGFLNAWIDYNNNGDLTDAGEQIATNTAIATGTTGVTKKINVSVPVDAAAGTNIGLRFRITSISSPGPTGAAGSGEVEDYVTTIIGPTNDFGDWSGAADASNAVSSTLRLGSLIDAEFSSNTDISATGDDLAGSDDEDGVDIPSMMAGAPAVIPIVVNNTSGSAAFLNAWIDYNNNGSFDDAGEQIANNVNVASGSTGLTLNQNITVPAAAVTGTNLGARFRLTGSSSPGSTGSAGGNGEVEDYVVNISPPTTDFGDFSTFASASSMANASLRLGALVDTEYTATTNVTATGDDSTGSDDEDGVTLPSMTAGAFVTIPIVVTNNSGSTAFLNAWIDFNNNGLLTDDDEHVATDASIATGTTGSTQNITITVPTTSVTDTPIGVRVRLTSVASPEPTGAVGTGEVEDYTTTLASPALDYGDWSGVADAASSANSTLRLGTKVDTEFASTRNAAATGDDITGTDDEDGVAMPTFTAGAPAAIPVVVTNMSGAASYLNVWIDYNNNGDLTDEGEQIATDVSITTSGTQNLNITVPANASTGNNLGVRFRLTDIPAPGVTGIAGIGEVEDYVVSIAVPTTDFGDWSGAADASSLASSDLRMGALADTEYVSTRNATATGDDITGSDDEDGVMIGSQTPGTAGSAAVVVTNNSGSAGYLNAWIDFNNNGSFTDVGEQIATNTVIATGTNGVTQTVNFIVPVDTIPGQRGARFRLTDTQNPTPTGASGTGEVEDHMVTITCLPIAVNPTSLSTPTVGTAFSQTITTTGGVAPYVYSVGSGTLPAGLTLNSSTGVISGTPTSNSTRTFSITSTDTYGCSGSTSYTVTPVCPTITVDPGTLADGLVGTAYSQTLSASGGTSPYTFTLTSGTLPNGLSLNASTGVISGTLTASNAAGVSLTFRATDANGCTGTRTVTLKICPVISLTPATLTTPVVGTAYSQTLSASGGASPYTFSLASGTLPAWATLSSAGDLSGMPNSTTPATFTVRTTDANGCSGTRAHTINPVCPTITLTPASLAQGVVGAAYSQTLAASGGTAPYSAWTITSGALPAGLTLDASTGVISGTPTASASPATSITVRVNDANGCQGSRSITLQICPVISLAPTTLPSPIVGTAYSQTLTASGGTAPYTFVVTSGALPAWATLTSAGVLSGTPTATTNATFTVRATDTNGCSGTFDYVLTPNCPTITVNPAAPAAGLVGTAYSQMLSATGGTSPYTFALTSGTLPDGLTLDPSSGLISGTPTTSNAAGVSLTFRATDANGCTGTRTVTLQICPVISLAPATLVVPTVGTAYSQTITASGGAAPYTFSLASGSLPSWVTLSAAGTLSGTPNSTTSATFTVRATDANGCSGTLAYTIAPVCPAISITTPSLAQGSVGSAYSQTLAASGGVAPYSAWTITSGTLPAGLTLNVSTGVLSGTPTASANPATSITVRVSDANGCQGSQTYSLLICPAITISPSGLTGIVAGSSYSQTITASGGVSPYVFTLASGTLPAGLTFNAATGVISGTPTHTTNATFTLRATDASGCVGTRNYSVTPACPTITLSPTTLPNGTVMSAYDQTITSSGGLGTLTYAVSSGALPSGLSLDPASGVISGTPTSSAAATFTVRVTDSNTCTATRSYTVAPACPALAMTPAALPTAYIGGSYNQSLAVSGGIAPYIYTLQSGTLPAGLTLDGGGTVSGVPTSSGSYSFTVRATDTAECSVSQAITLSVRTLSVGNLVFEDTNNNGLKDAGEPGVAGAVVQIFSTGADNAIGGAGSNADTQSGSDLTTTSSGTYFFTNLIPGNYYVKVTPPADYVYTGGTPSTTDDDVDNNNDGAQPGGTGTPLFSPVFNLNGGDESTSDGDSDAYTNYTIDFGLWTSVAVGNFIFIDINGDGVRNEGESLGDIYVELYASGSTPGVDQPVGVGSSGCSCKGRYYLEDLNPGDYFLHIPASQFSAGMPLEGLLPMSSVIAGDDDVGQDLLFNSSPAVNGASTAVFTLRPGLCPVGSAESGGEGAIDDDIDARVDLTRDLGVVAPAGTGFAAAERIRRYIVTGGFTATVLPGATTYATWNQDNAIGSANDDPDEDGVANLLEYALGTDPVNPLQSSRFTLTQDSTGGLVALLTQPVATRDDIIVRIETLTDLSRAADPSAWKTLSIASTTTFNGDDTLTRAYSNLEKLLVFKGLDTGFLRLRVDLDADRNGVAEASAASAIQGWSRQTFATGSRTFSMPLLQAAIFTGRVSSVSGNEVLLPYILTLPSGSHYLEVLEGPFAGQRFEIDAAASSGNTVVLQGAAQSFAGLADSRIVIRPHHMLGALLAPSAFGTEDRVLFFDTLANNFTTLANGGDEWIDGVLGMNMRPFAAHEAVLVQIRGTGAVLTFTGEVRANNFATPLASGTQLIAPGWPVSMAAPVTGLRSGPTPDTADRLRLWDGDISPELNSYTSYYLDNGTALPTWKSQAGEAAPAPLQNAFHGLFLIREAPLLLNQQAPW